jgi:glutathione S-transferase
MGAAPVIQDSTDGGQLTLAESGACMEYICHRHGQGRLFVKPSDQAYPSFLYWWHWANGSFQPTLSRIMTIRSSGIGDGNDHNPILAVTNDRFKRALQSMDERLKDNDWLAGSQFTVADIMVVFSLTTYRYVVAYSLAEYGNILQYLKRVGQREAYQKAMSKCDPGMELVLGPDPPHQPFTKS